MADAINVKDASGATVSVATNDALATILTAILAKVIEAPATEAKQDTLIAKDFATQATLADVLAKLSSDPATNTGLETIAMLLAGTLAVSAAALPLPAGASTSDKQDSQTAAVNLIGTRAYSDANIQHLAFDGAVQSTDIEATEITLVASKDCYVSVGSSPTATVGAGSMFLAAGVPFSRRITSGHRVSVIKASEAGALSVLPVA